MLEPRRPRFRVGRHASHGGRYVPRPHSARPGRRDARARPCRKGRGEDAHLAHREVRERDAGRRARSERIAEQSEHCVRVDGLGNGFEFRADARSAASAVRDVGRAQVARRHPSVRAPVRPHQRSRRPGDGLGWWSNRAAALRLRHEQHRASSRGNPRCRERIPERRSTATDQHRRTSRGCTIPRRDRGGHRGGRRAVERAPPIG